MKLHSQEINAALSSLQSSFFNYSINSNSVSIAKIDQALELQKRHSKSREEDFSPEILLNEMKD